MSGRGPIPAQPAWLGTGPERLALQIAGYEFPGAPPSAPGGWGWDANWLRVIGHVECAHGAWSFREPCLTTLELGDLIEWLEAFAAGSPRSTIEFAEPLVSFGAPRAETGRSITATLRQGATQPHRPRGGSVADAELVLTLRVSPSAVVEFVAGLRAALGAFPAR